MYVNNELHWNVLIDPMYNSDILLTWWTKGKEDKEEEEEVEVELTNVSTPSSTYSVYQSTMKEHFKCDNAVVHETPLSSTSASSKSTSSSTSSSSSSFLVLKISLFILLLYPPRIYSSTLYNQYITNSMTSSLLNQTKQIITTTTTTAATTAATTTLASLLTINISLINDDEIRIDEPITHVKQFNGLVLNERVKIHDDVIVSQDTNTKSIEDFLAIVKNQTAFKIVMNNITAVEEELYKNERLVSAFAYSAIIVISLFGNLLVCKVCILKMTKTNALILSLALSDLSMTIFNIPFNFFRIANYSWPFGKIMCYVVNFVQHLVVYVSSYTMLTIAIYRYFTVTDSTRTRHNNHHNHHHHYHHHVWKRIKECLTTIICCCFTSTRTYSLRNIIIVIIFVWIISALLAMMFTYSSDVVEKEPFFTVFIKHLIYTHRNETHLEWLTDASDLLTKNDKLLRCQNPLPSFWAAQLRKYFNQLDDLVKSLIVFLTQFFIPLTIAIILYIRIGKIINEQGRLASVQNDLKAKTKQKQKYRRIMMLVWVVCTFGVCWLPLHIFHILTDAGVLPFNQTIFTSVHWFAMLSVTCNPFIYCWLNPLFWASAKKCFCCCFGRTKEGNVQNIIINNKINQTSELPLHRKMFKHLFCCRTFAQKQETRYFLQANALNDSNDNNNTIVNNSNNNDITNNNNNLPLVWLKKSRKSNNSLITDSTMIHSTTIEETRFNNILNENDNNEIINLRALSLKVPDDDGDNNNNYYKGENNDGKIILSSNQQPFKNVKTLDEAILVNHSSVNRNIHFNTNDNNLKTIISIPIDHRHTLKHQYQQAPEQC